MTLPGGASYKVLVLPLPRPMNPDPAELSPEVKQKINELKEAGILIPSLPYKEDDFSSYGLERDLIVPETLPGHIGKENRGIFILSPTNWKKHVHLPPVCASTAESRNAGIR